MKYYLKAIDRRARILQPEGKYDEHGLWFPSTFERCECCNAIKKPTRKRPLTILKHCRTRKHVENLVFKYHRK